MRSFRPVHIVDDVVQGNHRAGVWGLAGQIIHAAEVYESLALQADGVEALPNVAVAKIVDQATAQQGGVTHSNSFVVAVVDLGRRSARKLWAQNSQACDVIALQIAS